MIRKNTSSIFEGGRWWLIKTLFNWRRLLCFFLSRHHPIRRSLLFVAIVPKNFNFITKTKQTWVYALYLFIVFLQNFQINLLWQKITFLKFSFSWTRKTSCFIFPTKILFIYYSSYNKSLLIFFPMTLFIQSPIFFLFIAAFAIIQANAGTCYHTTGCRTFNLCPFTE